MRPNFPVSSTEVLTEIRDLQETLMSLIGYDSNAFDNHIDVSGSIDIMESSIDAAGYALLDSRLYTDTVYSDFYKNELILYNARRMIND